MYGLVNVFRQRGSGMAIFDVPDQIVDRVFPAVALVHHERLQQRERAEDAIFHILDGAGHRHDVREVRDIREKAARLQARGSSPRCSRR